MAYKYPQIIDILIQHGADPFKKNKYNKNAVELMFENNNKDAIQILLKHKVLDNINTTERNNLLNLTTSMSIKKIFVPNNEQPSTYVLAKEDLIELPSGSNILVTSNVYKDKKTTSTIKELSKTSFITTEKVASTQQNHLALADSNTENHDKISNIAESLPLTQQNHLALADSNTENHDKITNIAESLPLTQQNMVKKSNIKQAMNVSAQNQSFNKNVNIFDKNNNSLWIEIKLLNMRKINIINNILRQNITYPIRIQIIRPLYDDNNLISVRAGPIHSFNTASKLCKLTNHLSNVCIITDKLSVQSF
ncbi:hypothetical protein NOVO_07930 [Rickettsiales bacterium Ac37b]|nr:hypothetical protein NOVO_07930 [Rickettsiales bacterium Ac37b]